MNTSSHLTQFEELRNQLQSTQSELLQQILVSSHASGYGLEFNFETVLTPEQFARNVPLVNYEQLRPWVDLMAEGQTNKLSVERCVAFFKTSGSTAKPKLIPVTSTLMRQKVSAFATYWEAVYRDYPAIADGTMVSNFSDSAESSRSTGNIEICSESSFWARRGRSLHSLSRWPLPASLRLIKDNDTRLYAMARILMQTDLHCIMCLNPSTLLQFCRTLQQFRQPLINGLLSGTWCGDVSGDFDSSTDSSVQSQVNAIVKNLATVESQLDLAKDMLVQHLLVDVAAAKRLQGRTDTPSQIPVLKTLWPMLDLIICWRSELVQPYLKQLEPNLEGIRCRDYITQSSECMMAIPLSDNSSGGTLAYTQQFFEFIPLEETSKSQPRTLFSWQLEEGQLYEVVVTTGGGLYRYRMGDCIRVNGFNGEVPVIEFRYRLGKTSSMTGEKLTEMHVLDAAKSATKVIGFEPAEFVCFPCNAEIPHYALLIDSGESGLIDSTLVQWAKEFERGLCESNAEYEDKFSSGRLGALVAFAVESGALNAARQCKKAEGVSEQQVKAEVLTRQFDLYEQFHERRILL